MRRRFRKAARPQYFSTAASLPADWDALLPDDHFLRKDSLRLYEQAALPDVSFGYCLVYNGAGEAVAAAYFQLLRIQPKHLAAHGLKPWIHAAWRAFTTSVSPKLLVSGHLFRHDVRAYYWKDEIEPFEAFKLYQCAVEEALRKSCAGAVLLKDPPENMLTYFQQFAPQYLLMRQDVSMEMDVPSSWETFADYEKALKHKYAQRARNVRKAASGLHIRELSAEETEVMQDELHALYSQVTGRQQVRLGYLSPQLLPLLRKQHPQSLRVWGFFEEHKLVAFASAWVKDETFDMFYIGFDYDRNVERQLYFNILFFAIEQAILLRKPKLILGRTALEAKARLGCRPVYLQTLLYIRNPVLRAWVTRMQGRLSAGKGEWESRHPFKS